MYLDSKDVEQLLDDISKLSAPKSCIILNFAESKTDTTKSLPIDTIDESLEKHEWNKEERLMFGDDGFNFDRYPIGKPANKTVGFAMYKKK